MGEFPISSLGDSRLEILICSVLIIVCLSSPFSDEPLLLLGLQSVAGACDGCGNIGEDDSVFAGDGDAPFT